VRKELISLPNFEVNPCTFYISSTVSLLVDIKSFLKEILLNFIAKRQHFQKLL
jgi:hypothetical protein